MHPDLTTEPVPSLLRMQLLGHLAAAARLALMEHEIADAVSLSVDADVGGVEFNCTLLAGGKPVAGWGQ